LTPERGGRDITANLPGIGAIGFVPKSARRGFLGGKIKAAERIWSRAIWRLNMPRFQKRNPVRNLQIAHRVEYLA